MTSDKRREARQVFMDVADLSASEQAAALDKACEGDAKLRAEVDELLQTDSRRDRCTTDPTRIVEVILDEATIVTSREQVGQKIGNYKLLQQIGEGGFGVVYMAQQEKPVRRRVALKIIKLGMDTKQVIARFEAERQALAMMDHPNIAKVLDAGSTETGRPYFVMELVKGEAITDYCDRHNVNVADRLELFQQTCNAVQHAHQKGIIHRDVKPSNVMITLHDGNPVPKVIDFGIAKAMNQRLTEKTVFTEYRQFIGTPEYMSPEQAEMSGMDVDTRSDVYSLGVLLYELLTGTTPFDAQKLRSAAYNEIQRIIREETPARPSTRLSTLDTLSSVAAHRHTEPRKLGLLIRGDLDWIVMKALEKDRTRRYETASGFADDIQRYRKNEAVIASPPSATYKLQKFVRRNKASVLAASLVMVALLLGVIGTSWGMAWALSERDHAEVQATTATRVSEFLVSLFEASDPFLARGEEPTAKDLLDVGVQRIDELDDEPETQAVMQRTIGHVLLRLGRIEESEPLIESAVAWHEQHAADDEHGLAQALHLLANHRNAAGDAREGETLARRVVDIRSRLHGRNSLEVAESLNTLGNAIWRQGDFARAEAVAREALTIREEHLDPMDESIGQSLHNLGSLRYLQGDLDEAEAHYQRVIEIIRHSGDDDSHDFATTLHTLAMVNESQGRFEEALELQDESLAIRERVLGPDHWHVALSLTTIGSIYTRTQRAADAEPLIRRAVHNGVTAWGEGHHDLQWMRWNLARCLIAQNKLDEAERLMKQVVQAVGRPELAFIRSTALDVLVEVHLAQEMYEDAEAVARRALAAAEAADGKNSLETAMSQSGLARALAGQTHHADAIEMFERALKVMRSELDAFDADLLRTERGAIEAMLEIGRIEDAHADAHRITSTLRQHAMRDDGAARQRLCAAQWLLDCPVTSVRDAEAALRFARLASDQLDGEHPEALATVAAAQAAAGNTDGAASTLRDALQSLDTNDARREWLTDQLEALTQ